MRTTRLTLAATSTLVLLAGLSTSALSQDEEVVGPLGANYFTATDAPISGGDFDWVPSGDYTEAAAVTAVTDFAATMAALDRAEPLANPARSCEGRI